MTRRKNREHEQEIEKRGRRKREIDHQWFSHLCPIHVTVAQFSHISSRFLVSPITVFFLPFLWIWGKEDPILRPEL